MDTFTAIVAEDEPMMLKALRQILGASEKVDVIGWVRDGRDCVDLLAEEPDALFLDVEMPGLTGIEVAEIAVQEESPPLIAFITGYSDYAVKAFELAAIDYIVKTDDLEALRCRVEKAVDRIEGALASGTSNTEQVWRAVSEMAERFRPEVKRKLPVKDYAERTVRLIDVTSIVYAERRDRRVYVETGEGEFPTYYTISRLEERLSGSGFFRANRGAIVNLDYVEHLVPDGSGSYDIVFRDSEDKRHRIITVSRTRARELMDVLGLSDATSGG